jgi:hypothetical protein
MALFDFGTDLENNIYVLAALQTKELNNGRLAMIAIAGFVAQELVNHKEILETLNDLIGGKKNA